MSAPPSFSLQPSAFSLRRLYGVLLVGIVLLAFWLRFAAIGWGLPYTDHPDEPAAVNRVLGMLRRNDWNPRFFGKPSLHYYILRLTLAAQVRYGIATGQYRSIDDLPRTTDQYLTAPDLFVWGRFPTVLLGVASVALLFWVGRRWWGVGVGLVSAALLAVLPFHVRHSQYITPDVPSAFLALGTLAVALRLPDDRRWRWYALAGLCAGLATSTKYNAVMVVLAIVAAHVAAWGRDSLRQAGRLAWASVWSLVGFAVTTPYLVLASGTFFTGLLKQVNDYAPQDQGDLRRTWPVLSYLRFVWEDGLRQGPALAALAGIGFILARRDRRGLIVLAFVLPYPLLLLPQSTHYFRNLLPIIPPLALLAAIGVVETGSSISQWFQHKLSQSERLPEDKPSRHQDTRDLQNARQQTSLQSSIARLAPSRPGGRRAFQPASEPTFQSSWSSWLVILNRRLSAWPAALLAGLVLAGPLQASIEITRFYAQPHSKVRAARYIDEQLPRGAPIAVALHPVQWAGRAFVTPLEDVALHDAVWYRAQGYRYLVANPEFTDRQRYAALRAEAQLLATIPGDQDGQPGPRLEILDLGAHPDQLAIERREVIFGRAFRLLGYQSGAGDVRAAFGPLSSGSRVPRGQALQLNLYWQALEQAPADYAIFLHLLDAQGQTVAQRDTLIRYGDYPTTHWQPGEIVLDLADLPLPVDLAPGEYNLELGVYDIATMARLPVPGTSDNAIRLVQVTVVK